MVGRKPRDLRSGIPMLRERHSTKIRSGRADQPAKTNHAPSGRVKITVQGRRLL